jgi:hypothetical protein
VGYGLVMSLLGVWRVGAGLCDCDVRLGGVGLRGMVGFVMTTEVNMGVG